MSKVPKRLLFLAVSGTWATLAALARALRRLAGVRGAPQVVLYYHAVAAAERPRFARQMDALRRRARPVAPERLGTAGSRREALVTFDDGLRSVLTNALPELAARNIPCVIFVVAGALGRTPAWGSYRQTDPATAAADTVATAGELRAALGPLVTIGSHTVTHARLTAIAAQSAQMEIFSSRARLETALGRPVTLLSFPYGAASDAVIAWCREAGYERLFATAASAVGESTLVIRRVRVDPGDWLWEFYLKLWGGYDWLPLALRCKRRLAAAAGLRRQPTPRAVSAETDF